MERHIHNATFVANLWDNRFELFKIRFGVGGLLDLIPGLGDLINALVSFYIVWIGIQIKMPSVRIIQMAFNVIFIFLISLIPVVGDGAYILYKPNIRNVDIIKRYLDQDNRLKV